MKTWCKKQLLRIGCFFTYYMSIYYLWSRVYRYFYEEQYLIFQIKQCNTLVELERKMATFSWTEDTPLQLWDQIGYPARVEFAFNDPGMRRRFGNDCDEAAIYCVEQLRNIRGYSGASIMSINYMNDKRVGGHNVCAFKDITTNKWHHIGNWARGRASEGFFSPEEIARDVSAHVGMELLAWSRADYRLRRIETRIY